MHIALFCHSLWSDWNHGNAHFLRGVVSELSGRGHRVSVFEPRDSWSLANLLCDHGERALHEVRRSYPNLASERYDLASFALEPALEGVDLVIVHEWSDPELVHRIGLHHAEHPNYLLLFHDTHHRLVTQPHEMARYDLGHFDGVLAFGEVLRELYLRRGLTPCAFTWHEAADVRVFHPRVRPNEGDVVWIGNWGDGERSHELHTFLLEPICALGLRARVHGVRYPDEAQKALAHARIGYAGYLANHRVPEVFAAHSFTAHVPRRPYVQALVGVPTIRVFEALACGIPLVSAPWQDVEGLFVQDRDFLVARDGQHMTALMRALVHEPSLRASLREHGLATLRARHTCAHRVDELFAICRELGLHERKVESLVRV